MTFGKWRDIAVAVGLATSFGFGLAVAAEDLDAVLKRTNQYFDKGNYDAALSEARKLEAGIKAQFGTNHPNYVIALNQLLRIYAAQGKYADAEVAAQRGLAIRQKVLNPADPKIAESDVNLASIYKLEGKYAPAEDLFQRALAFEQKVLGEDHPSVALALNDLAALYEAENKLGEAEELYQRSLKIREKQVGPDSPVLAESLGNIAIVYLAQGRYAQSEESFKRALAIQQKALGAGHPLVGSILNNLAEVYRAEAKDAEAEKLYQQALAIWEKTLGPDNPSIALGLRNLAELYQAEGKYDQSEALYRRVLATEQRVLGATHPETAATINNFAGLYVAEGKYAEAEGLYQQALSIWEKALGADSPNVAMFSQNLGMVYEAEGKPAEAEPRIRHALEIREKAFGGEHPDVAASLFGLAMVLQSEGKVAPADATYQRALAIEQKTLGPNHPNVAQILMNLCTLYSGPGGNEAQALAYVRKATAAVIAHNAGASGAGDQASSLGSVAQRSDFFLIQVGTLAMATQDHLGPADALGHEAFEAAQWANQSAAALGLQQMAARFAGDGALGALVRQRQDLTAAWQNQNKALIEAESKPQNQQDQTATDAARKQMADTEAAIAANEAQLAARFPDYAALANPKPLKVEELQQLLRADEAMAFFLTGADESYVFALTHDSFDWKVIPVTGKALTEQVSAFRHGLDVGSLSSTGPSGKPELFDLEASHQLYTTLLGPVDELIKGKTLMVVPSGVLTALPFHLLLTEKPAAAKPANLDFYRDAAWLIKRQAVSVLPSVGSLKALRTFASKSNTNVKPMIGFGDPAFDPNAPNPDKAPTPNQPGPRSIVTRSYTDFWQGADVDRSALSRSLPQLPDTAVELRAVAQKLNAPESDIHLGRDASETTVKKAPLADYRIVYFATHGLVAGDIKGVAEPSLVLSIPAHPSEFDDGLLTASEVARLKLNADWVVLSACNTVAGGKPGAEALSGLARAFFYAGARALLVTHWSVESDAATRLTTSTFDILAANPAIGRAEALRRAMLGYLNDTSNRNAAYPAFWGPFEIVGEGAAD
jgi:CHAT domain-containing protein/tetratricopeptide (TPR) repeat protein